MTLACPIKLIKSEKRFCNNKGFTVVELLVVVGIIAVLTTIGVASYNNFNDRKVLESAVEELKSNLRLAQSKAINNEKDSNLANCLISPLDGWVINFTSNVYKCQCGSVESPNTFPLFDRDVNNDGTPDIGVNIVGVPVFVFKALGGTDLPADNTITLSYKSVPDQIVVISTGGDIN